MVTDPRIERLKLYRLQADLSYERLGAQMRATGCNIRTRALHLALTGRLQTQPRETTLYKIGQFLDRVTGSGPRKRTTPPTLRPKLTTTKRKRRAAA